MHVEAARIARRHGVVEWFGIGAMSCQASREFGSQGYCYEDIEDMARSIRARIHEGVNLLVKGSRSAGMERLVRLLTQGDSAGKSNAV